MTAFPLPFQPRRLLIGASNHGGIAARIATARPDLEIQHGPMLELTAAQVAWADTYMGFRRPPAAADLANVRWVHCTGAGVDAWLAGSGIPDDVLLTRTPESFGPAIAEWAVSRVLAIQLQLLDVAAAQREGRWAPREITPVAGTRALCVGTGDIGTHIARQLGALGVRCTGVSRTAQPNPAFETVHPISRLAELVSESDWIILTLPNTPATRGLVSRDILSRCRGAVVLNAGRGSVLAQDALPEALDRGWLRGAALDVFEVEPLPAESPLWRDSRVLISPHISGLTTVEGAANGFLECAAALEAGTLPRWVVDRSLGY